MLVRESYYHLKLVLEFVVFIENEFNIEFDDDEINEDNFENLIKIAEFIISKTQQ